MSVMINDGFVQASPGLFPCPWPSTIDSSSESSTRWLTTGFTSLTLLFTNWSLDRNLFYMILCLLIPSLEQYNKMQAFVCRKQFFESRAGDSLFR